MKRRTFITLLGSATAPSLFWPLAASAQQPERVRSIGVLMNTAADDPEGRARFAAFEQGLQQLGWTDRAQSGARCRPLPQIRGGIGRARARCHPGRGGPVMAALQQATRSVPIVFALVSDPVGSGYVASLARPGGNATGFASTEFGISGKWLELLKEIAPRVTRVAVFRDPTTALGIGQLGAIQSAAPSFGMELSPIDVRDTAEIERAVTTFVRAALANGASGQRGDSIVRAPDTRPEPGSSARATNDGLIVPAGPLAARHRELIIALAARHRCPRSTKMRSERLQPPSRSKRLRLLSAVGARSRRRSRGRQPALGLGSSRSPTASCWSTARLSSTRRCAVALLVSPEAAA